MLQESKSSPDSRAPRLTALDEAQKREYWATLALRHCKGIGPALLAKLLKNFGSAIQALEQIQAWPQIGVSERFIRIFKSDAWRKDAKKEWNAAAKSSCGILLWSSPFYPAKLRHLRDAPALLYYSGALDLLNCPAIAIVGSRTASSRNLQIAYSLAKSLARCGITIISGMAAGIDSRAHAGSLEELGKSIGVLGTGIDVEYPKCNRKIYAHMIASGLLLSEFTPSASPAAYNFPIRNRIISGLSLGVVVVEAAARSGSLITARRALDQDREVFAVPGQALDQSSLGCQNLIREGAHPVFCVDDILRNLANELKIYQIDLNKQPSAVSSLADLPSLPPEKPAVPSQGADIAKELIAQDDSQRIIALLQANGAMNVELLAQELKLQPDDLASSLIALEMLGQIKRLPGARYETN